MKKLIILLNFLPVIVAAADDRYPYAFEPNLKSADAGLSLSVVVDKTTLGTSERPSITVTFSNESSTVVALLNHFALTAVGPWFTPLICNPDDPNRYGRAAFKNQVLIDNAKPPWIVLKPGEVHRFQSPLSSPLPAGRHWLRVRYSVDGAADPMIVECRKQPSCPKDFWHGNILSNGVKIEVKQEDQTKP